jgi:hypothetical protein
VLHIHEASGLGRGRGLGHLASLAVKASAVRTLHWTDHFLYY